LFLLPAENATWAMSGKRFGKATTGHKMSFLPSVTVKLPICLGYQKRLFKGSPFSSI
jgi:hypothetical protein